MTHDSHEPYLRLERRFDVPPETVFDTLTQPELMRVWWGDDAEFDLELHVGGQWTILRREGDEEFRATGTYVEIQRPSRLRYTFGMPQFSPNSDTITIGIEAAEGGSTMVFEHAGLDIAKELRELPHGEASASELGWEQGFDLMAAAWSKQQG